PAFGANQGDRDICVEEKLLQVVARDRGDVLNGLQLPVPAIHHHTIELRISVGEPNAPLIAASENGLALVANLRVLQSARLRCAEGGGGGDGYELGGVVE